MREAVGLWGRTSAVLSVWRPEDDLWESVLCPSHLGPEDETQGAQLEGQDLLRWSHLVISSFLFSRQGLAKLLGLAFDSLSLSLSIPNTGLTGLCHRV